MENIIQKIIDIDQRAQQKCRDAKQRRDEVEAEVKEEIQKMNAETRESAETNLSNLRSSENELLIEARQAIADDLAKKKEFLERLYQEKHLAWEQELFQKILRK